MLVTGASASSGGVLSFGFGRQSVASVLGDAQPACQRLGIVPGHVNYRRFVGLRKARVTQAVARVADIELFARCTIVRYK